MIEGWPRELEAVHDMQVCRISRENLGSAALARELRNKLHDGWADGIAGAWMNEKKSVRDGFAADNWNDPRSGLERKGRSDLQAWMIAHKGRQRRRATKEAALYGKV